MCLFIEAIYDYIKEWQASSPQATTLNLRRTQRYHSPGHSQGAGSCSRPLGLPGALIREPHTRGLDQKLLKPRQLEAWVKLVKAVSHCHRLAKTLPCPSLASGACQFLSLFLVNRCIGCPPLKRDKSPHLGLSGVPVMHGLHPTGRPTLVASF